jgi:hypothetical protein
MQMRQITPLALSEFILELQQAGVGSATIRSCLGLLQSIFARAVEWDRASVNVVKLIVKPCAPRVRAIKPLRHRNPDCVRRQTQDQPDLRRPRALRPAPQLASLLIHEGRHSIMQVSEWMGHSAATLLTHYAHLIADLPGGPDLPNEDAIKTARSGAKLTMRSSQIVPKGNSVITYWYYPGRDG